MKTKEMNEGCFYKLENHFYKKMDEGALHVMEGISLNFLPEYFIPIVTKTSSEELKQITEDEFNLAVRTTILELELYNYFKPVE